MALRLGLAALFGAVLGLEREWHGKPAGLRTHMLVGLGSAAFFIITLEFMLGPHNEAEGLSLDPTRIYQGVISGIGFLGAGAIIQSQGDVKGLTTGACIWVAGGIGLACGGGFYVLAALLTGFSLLVLMGVGAVERRLDKS